MDIGMYKTSGGKNVILDYIDNLERNEKEDGG
jgi:hypothetical protein